MAGTSGNRRRSRGHIRRRGSSFQVLVFAGVDPLTGKDYYLTESTTDERQAQKILTRLLSTVDEQRNPRTKTTLGAALEAWLRTHEAEETTFDGYRGYMRRTIEPALGKVALAKITPQVLEEFYADLRRCRHRCRDGEPAVDHRTAMAHECRSVRHKRRPGRPGTDEHHCATAGCVVVECPPHSCVPMSASSNRQVHWIISSALGAAVRWDWIHTNPADIARKPKLSWWFLTGSAWRDRVGSNGWHGHDSGGLNERPEGRGDGRQRPADPTTGRLVLPAGTACRSSVDTDTRMSDHGPRIGAAATKLSHVILAEREPSQRSCDTTSAWRPTTRILDGS